MLSECRNHITFNLSKVRVFHVFYFLAGANFMIIAPYCFYVQGCRTSYLNPRTMLSSISHLLKALLVEFVSFKSLICC
ncbi:hypothetical protein CAG51_10835 [Vibrio sp. V24_P1S3T111]|nr:hypothetical protein [Vibrio sp. V24_P1S3T111]